MTGGLEIFESGHGEPVVMVHGDIGGALDTFGTQMPLASNYRLRLVNRRGFGNSTDTAAEDFLIDAADVADLLEPGTHLVGHSYGGVVSLMAASMNPNAIRSLTVFEPPAFGLVPDRPDVIALIDTITQLVSAGVPPEEFFPRFIGAVSGRPAPDPQPLPAAIHKAVSIQMAGRWPWEARIPLDELAAAGFPVLVVSGGHSPMFDSVCDVLEQRLGARREVLAGLGHGIPGHGEPLNAILRDFWSSAATKT